LTYINEDAMKSIIFTISFFFALNMAGQPTEIHERATVYVTADATINLTSKVTTLSCDLAEGSATVTISAPEAWNEGWQVHVVQYNTSVTRQVTLNTMAASGNEFKASNTDASLITLLLGAYDVKIYVCAQTSAGGGRQWLSIK